MLITDLILAVGSFAAFPLITAAAGILLLISAVWKRRLMWKSFAVFISACIAITAFGIGYYTDYCPSTSCDGITADVEGTADDYSTAGKCILKNCIIGGKETDLSITVYLPEGTQLTPGDVLFIPSAELSSVREEDNVFLWHTVSKGAWLRCSAYYTENKITQGEDTNPLSFIKSLQHNTAEKISSLLPREEAAVARALITGDNSGFSDETASSVRLAGVSHIFAVSGMHLSIWTALVFFMFARGSRNKKIPLITAAVFTLFYVAFTGFSPSVLRAGIMLLTVFTGSLISAKADPLNSLGISVTALLVINPFLAGNVSFLLSVTATWSIIRFYPFIAGKQKAGTGIIKRRLTQLFRALLVSLCVIFTSIPVCSIFFGYISLISPVSSLITTPLAEVIMVLTAIGVLCPAPVAGFVFTLCGFVCRALLGVVGFFSRMTFAVVTLDKAVVLPWFILTAAAVAVIFILGKEKRRQLALITILSSSLLILSLNTALTLSHKGDVQVLVTGAGNSPSVTLLNSFDRQAVILGAGGDYYSAQRTKSFITSSGVSFKAQLFRLSDNKAENRAAKYLLEFASDNDTLTNGTLHFFNDDCFTFTNGNGIQSGMLTINGKKILICLNPLADFSDYDTSADYLICTKNIPVNLDASAFEKIIVVGNYSAERLKLPDNAVTTADEGEIKFTIRHTAQ